MSAKEVSESLEEFLGDLLDDKEEYLNTESSQNDFSKSIPDSPGIRQICSSVAEHIYFEEEDLERFYDSDGNWPPSVSSDDVNAS